MFLGIRKKYWWFLAATAGMAGLVLFVNLSPVFALKRTAFAGPNGEAIENVLASQTGKNINIFRIDTDDVLHDALKQAEIDNVNLSLSLPDGLTAEVNRFEPAAFVWGKKLYGLDRNCRLIPYDTTWEDFNLPVFTGVTANHLFAGLNDYRAVDVLAGLEMAREEFPELYVQIAEVDFSDRVYIKIYTTTSAMEYLATAQDFKAQLVKLHAINSMHQNGRGGVYNLLYDGVIIKEK